MQRPLDQIYYLPIDQTIIQKELVELLVRLHRPNILKILGKLKEEPPAPEESLGPVLNDSVMLETFVANSKQVGNHPTLLVNHFIPRNLLLLDTKENLIDSSSKYVKLDEMLNRLIERKLPKTIIISVGNGKELDLVESILIGKNGLQYYRFSGSSIYYENHGSFDFSKRPAPQQEPSRSKSTTPGARRGRKRRGQGSRGGRGGHTTSRSRQSSVTPSHRTGDEYTPPISKNSPLYRKKQNKEDTSKLSVYLILSNQLKNLTQFDELRSDLIVSLDSNLEQIAEPALQVPILKLIITNSLEYFDQQLQREVPTLRASPEIYNKFLTYLTVAYRSRVRTNHRDTPVKPELIDWMVDTENKPFPSDYVLPNFPVASLKIEDLARECEESMEKINLVEPYDVQRYEFFDPSLKFDTKTKRVKLEPLEIPAEMPFRQYQRLLSAMVNERAKELEDLLKVRHEHLEIIHLDDTRRQHTLEDNNAQIGAMYKKLRTDTTNNDSMGKQVERLQGDLEKLQELVKQMEERSSEYTEKVKDGNVTSEDVNSKRTEVVDLKLEEAKLEVQLKEDNAKTDDLRTTYQSKSSEAATLSTELQMFDKEIEKLTKSSDGLFMRLAERQVDDEIAFVEEQTASLERDNSFLEGYLQRLDLNLKQRQRNGSQALRTHGR